MFLPQPFGHQHIGARRESTGPPKRNRGIIGAPPAGESPRAAYGVNGFRGCENFSHDCVLLAVRKEVNDWQKVGGKILFATRKWDG